MGVKTREASWEHEGNEHVVLERAVMQFHSTVVVAVDAVAKPMKTKKKYTQRKTKIKQKRKRMKKKKRRRRKKRKRGESEHRSEVSHSVTHHATIPYQNA